MGDEKDELKQRAKGNSFSPNKHVDVDGEHDSERARKLSTANLRREADYKKAAVGLHDVATTKTYDSVQSGLLLLAKEMHLSREEVREAQQNDPEHNNQIGVARIERVVHMISADAYNLNATLSTVPFAHTMSEVKTVWGAWSTCRNYIDLALSWYRDNGGMAGMSVGEIDLSVNGMISQLGTTPQDLPQDRAEPEGDPKKMSDKAFEDELAAANAALDSWEVANTSDAPKVAALIQQIGVKGSYSAAFTRHRARVVKLQERVDKLRDKYPENKTINEAAFQLAGGLKRK